MTNCRPGRFYKRSFSNCFHPRSNSTSDKKPHKIFRSDNRTSQKLCILIQWKKRKFSKTCRQSNPTKNSKQRLFVLIFLSYDHRHYPQKYFYPSCFFYLARQNKIQWRIVIKLQFSCRNIACCSRFTGKKCIRFIPWKCLRL